MSMKSQIKLCLKISWLTAAIIILLMGTNMCAASDEACFQAGETMFLLMFWLSFPASLVFAVASLVFLDSGSIHYPSDFITAWIVMTCGGLLQWFVIIPCLFQKPGFTILDLKTPAPFPLRNADESKTNDSGPVVQTMPILKTNAEVHISNQPKAVKLSRSRTRKSKPIRPGVPFDKKGRTPLERVIGSFTNAS